MILTIIVLSGCHVGRFFVYNFANITDHKKFPERTIAKSEIPFEFASAMNEEIMFNEWTESKYTTPEELDAFHKSNKTVSFMVIQDDTIRYQWFADNWEEEDIVTSFSMSKSVISALIGKALEEGYIKDLNEPITNYIKTFKNEGFEKITIQHLLDMRTGIDYNENYYNPFGNVAAGYYGRNLDRHISNLRIKGEPGKEFEYISIATQLLGVIIEEATGKSVSEYLEQSIWSRIGTSHDATWSMDRKKGREKSFCCINAMTEDFAKFARLYLNLGNWNGEQIIGEDWVKKSVQLQADTEDNFYQNQWWLWGYSNPNHKEITNYAAQGHLGQIMFVNPTRKMIILRFGKGWGNCNWSGFMNQIGMSFKK